MRLVDIDDYAASNETGKTAVLKALEKWERQHPLTEIELKESENYDVLLKKDGNDWIVMLKRKAS